MDPPSGLKHRSSKISVGSTVERFNFFSVPMTALLETIKDIDNRLSNRHIDLDPGGYWLVMVDRANQQLKVEHYSNNINESGLAVDPETGEVIACQGGAKRLPTLVLTGRSAKELCVKIFEQLDRCPVTMLDHAAYLGRELMRAELSLTHCWDYIQD
jgi:dihydropteroate synthase